MSSSRLTDTQPYTIENKIDIKINDPTPKSQPNKEQPVRLDQEFLGYLVQIVYNPIAFTKQPNSVSIDSKAAQITNNRQKAS